MTTMIEKRAPETAERKRQRVIARKHLIRGYVKYDIQNSEFERALMDEVYAADYELVEDYDSLLPIVRDALWGADYPANWMEVVRWRRVIGTIIQTYRGRQWSSKQFYIRTDRDLTDGIRRDIEHIYSAD